MPTLKQKKVVEAMIENMALAKPKPLTTVLENVGYEPSVAKTPARVINGKGVQELLEEYLPDSELADIHARLLRKQEVVVTKGDDGGIEFTGQPHSDVKGALDMAYKLKGAYAAEKKVNLNANIDVKTDTKEADELAKRYEEEFKQLLLKKE